MRVGIHQYYWVVEGIYRLRLEPDHQEFEVCEGLMISVGLLNDLCLLSGQWKGTVVDAAYLVLENHSVVVDCTVGHLSLFVDLMIGFDCDLDFSIEIGIHLFLLTYFVVGICLWDETYLSVVIYLAKEIGI